MVPRIIGAVPDGGQAGFDGVQATAKVGIEVNIDQKCRRLMRQHYYVHGGFGGIHVSIVNFKVKAIRAGVT